MKRTMLLLAAGAMAVSPTAILAKAGSPTTQATPQGPANGVGWDHLKSGNAFGQPGFECEDARPGNAQYAPGSAFNPDGVAGTHYAGEQPQNQRNTASVSQYDTACMHQPQ
jgi:hypothetical protein